MSKEEQPVWEEFLERMEETFKEYLENLDIGYVIQNFLERFNLEDYYVKESTTHYGGKSYSLKKSMKEDKKIDLDKVLEIISLIENFNEANVEELKVLEVYPFLNSMILQLRKALGDELNEEGIMGVDFKK